MSASSICPLCQGTTFRSPDEDNNYIICECSQEHDPNEESSIAVFMALHEAIIKAGFSAALDSPKFCGSMLGLAEDAVKISKHCHSLDSKKLEG